MELYLPRLNAVIKFFSNFLIGNCKGARRGVGSEIQAFQRSRMASESAQNASIYREIHRSPMKIEKLKWKDDEKSVENVKNRNKKEE